MPSAALVSVNGPSVVCRWPSRTRIADAGLVSWSASPPRRTLGARASLPNWWDAAITPAITAGSTVTGSASVVEIRAT